MYTNACIVTKKRDFKRDNTAGPRDTRDPVRFRILTRVLTITNNRFFAYVISGK